MIFTLWRAGTANSSLRKTVSSGILVLAITADDGKQTGGRAVLLPAARGERKLRDSHSPPGARAILAVTSRPGTKTHRRQGSRSLTHARVHVYVHVTLAARENSVQPAQTPASWRLSPTHPRESGRQRPTSLGGRACHRDAGLQAYLFPRVALNAAKLVTGETAAVIRWRVGSGCETFSGAPKQ